MAPRNTRKPQSPAAPVAISNGEIAAVLNRLADWSEVAGEDMFRVRAYRNAARAVEGMSQSVADLAAEGQDLSKFRWIGKSIARKLDEIVKTGRLKQLEQLEQRLPGDLTEILSLPSLGPKRVRTLHDDLAITTLAQLEQAAREHKIRKLFGLGPRTEERILEELTRRKGAEGRVRLDMAEEIARSLVAYLRAIQGVREVVVAGSFRRRRETVGDLDLLVTCGPRSSVMEQVLRYPTVQEVHASGTTRSALRLRDGLNVDVRVVPDEAYGAALHYFTGSKTHNIAIRRMGIARGLKINEYGVFQGKDRVAGRTEEEVFAAVGLPYIEPELREGRGEIEAARDGWLPNLVTTDSVRGDLHCHTLACDGQATIEQLAEAGQDMGYEYLAITDPSKSLSAARGLDENRLAEQIHEIDRLNGRLRHFRILKGIEVAILEDGSLDLDDAVLADLDVRVCAIHTHVDLPKSQQTDRIIRAMDNPYFNILAHPTGRLIGQREPYSVDLERVMRAARQRGCILEVNASPQRLDLSDVHIRMAKDLGVKLSISADARRISDFGSLRYGVDQARRGWLESADVVNTRPLQELQVFLHRTPRAAKPKPR